MHAVHVQVHGEMRVMLGVATSPVFGVKADASAAIDSVYAPLLRTATCDDGGFAARVIIAQSFQTQALFSATIKQ